MIKKMIIAAAAAALLAGCASNSMNATAPQTVTVTTVNASSPAEYMDQQEAEFRQTLEGTGVTIIRTPKYIALVLQSSVTFPFDKADLVPEFYPTLTAVAALLVKYNQTAINVNGYTDSTGSDAYNLKLSQERADSVAGYLINKGVDPSRVIPTGYGKADPVASNDTKEGRAQNRRVEIRLAPPAAPAAAAAPAMATK
ncbi:OmpA family protein [Martelella sp. HB161492]|uniref:OmpA family protein n=1 Tax=Martelella sp. HB161492 TaxID=2720726 RepID=UPI0015926DAD|nr:OmpA family protein [Martelella sp. HB161492]